ncbi:hypothetical protein BJ741DRAFT_603809 [Chytriomyces cf. hyalinus JEL632]|nr:hypothetical protein BJ741DRAFT_603809 [Chytriomyces cf. hyalinus JEL632]
MPTLAQLQQQPTHHHHYHHHHMQQQQQHRIILPMPIPEPMMYPLAFNPSCWSPESTVSPVHSPKLVNLPLPPILLSSHHKEASPIPSLSSLSSWHSSDRCCANNSPPSRSRSSSSSSSSSRMQKRLEQRKNAEKQRRDILRTCIQQVKQLLPRKAGISRVVSKERAVEQAYEYIVELQQETEMKAHLLKQLELEAEIVKASF